MNDEELRAFLASGEPRDPQKPEKSRAEETRASTEEVVSDPAAKPGSETMPESAAEPESKGMSFDELMGFGQSEPVADQRGEQLEPLILPGFSPEPRATRPLPPVFQAEKPAPVAAPEPETDPKPSVEAETKAAPESSSAPLDLEATQPYNVVLPVDHPKDPVREAEPEASSPEPPTDTSDDVFAALGLRGSDSREAPTKTAPIVAPAASPARPAASPARPAPAAASAVAPATPPSPAAAQLGDDGYERISVTGSENRGRKALPWIIVGGGAALALVASVFVINAVRGPAEPAPAPAPTQTSEPAPTPEDEEDEPTTPTPEPQPEQPTEAPAVEVGSVWELPIDQWGITVERSERFGGSTPYTLQDGNSRAMFDELPVAAGFSEACAAARAPLAWGLLRKDDNTLEVVRPEPRCASQADAALYDTIWGLLDHMAKTAKPA